MSWHSLTFPDSVNQFKYQFGFYWNRGQLIVKTKLFYCFQNWFYFLPSFVVCFLEFQIVFGIVLTAIINYFNADMKLLFLLFFFCHKIELLLFFFVSNKGSDFKLLQNWINLRKFIVALPGLKCFGYTGFIYAFKGSLFISVPVVMHQGLGSFKRRQNGRNCILFL